MPTESGQARIFDRIQPGLASMGVADQASMAAARILADAEAVAAGKVDVAQKALIVAQTELDGVRALVRAAQGEGASRRTDDRLLASYGRTRAADPLPKQCPKLEIHAEHTWSLGASARTWQCKGVTTARCEIPACIDTAEGPDRCGQKGPHGSHDTEGGHCHGQLRGASPSGVVTAWVSPCAIVEDHALHTWTPGDGTVQWCRGRPCFPALPREHCRDTDQHSSHYWEHSMTLAAADRWRLCPGSGA